MPYLVMVNFCDGSEPRMSEELSLEEARNLADLVRKSIPKTRTVKVWLEETVVPTTRKTD